MQVLRKTWKILSAVLVVVIVLAALFLAGMRLIGIIERSRNCNSKDLAALTSRINAICDKQEKEIKRSRN